ncbi:MULTISPECIES: ABC transporter ATP-binding protein [unclassified Bradyrhizobium]|uniref:ABC transporter ATP-binding protein n=1 Tax=unclassified Bradyrhizobium TaxID=2631580 RepID=UPI001CD6089F|nr:MULTISPECIES: ABC transporter ATP-binding protein [unclassified Bradyrhizobium]MCA1391364.1 ABC transporter ATP-binding protein [Bradyrhizobium sp. IC3123]MCA1425042.1 ABC transporter ATP-binding protein [Bradyrhizobium sp. NBAIM16]MCA1480175.1 ABC transporter ATP-binding protein [Bradyrhizobium sp. NBAIM08]MCA1509741.1 ABC transporter ATP-binding protein [Bradyrhizobium sp. NBAIM01]MCA1548116.1 ABC transporter ATP-binding protein [Bradyrhizobium sp. BRP19]
MIAAPSQSLALARDEDRAAAARTRIAVQGLAKRFNASGREFVAVDDVSFEVKQGEFVALLGPSGCGKSTILNMVAGLLPRSGGRILIDQDTVETGEVNPRVGYVFQRDTLFPWRTVEQNIGYGLEIAGVPKSERAARVATAIEKAGLAGFAQSFPRMLSGGMRQRVALMRTLILEPEILLMDEPFGALDTHTKLEMHKTLLEIWERERQTVLFVTHDLGEALTLASRIILLSARPGRLKEDFDVAIPRPRDPVAVRETAEFARLYSHIWHSLGEEFRRTRAD